MVRGVEDARDARGAVRDAQEVAHPARDVVARAVVHVLADARDARDVPGAQADVLGNVLVVRRDAQQTAVHVVPAVHRLVQVLVVAEAVVEAVHPPAKAVRVV